MEKELFFGMIAAVFVANIFAAMVVYGFIQATRKERDGQTTPQHVYIAIAMPLGFVALYAMAYWPV